MKKTRSRKSRDTVPFVFPLILYSDAKGRFCPFFWNFLTNTKNHRNIGFFKITHPEVGIDFFLFFSYVKHLRAFKPSNSTRSFLFLAILIRVKIPFEFFFLTLKIGGQLKGLVAV
jgi:hypothetical protein